MTSLNMVNKKNVNTADDVIQKRSISSTDIPFTNSTEWWVTH